MTLEGAPRPYPEDPCLALQKSLIADLVFAIPIIRQQTIAPPDVLEYARQVTQGARQICEGQGWSMGRMITAAISIVDAPRESD